MFTDSIGNIPIYRFHSFARYPEVLQFTTTCKSGNQPDDQGMNLGVFGEDDAVRAHANRRLLSEALNLPAERLLFSKQVHECSIRIISEDFFKLEAVEKSNYLLGVDAILTSLPRTCICSLTADCSAILMYDPVKKVIATVHAGWRGTQASLVKAVIAGMTKEWNCNPADILAGIAPCISGKAYEVGEEVAQKFEEVFGKNESIIIRHRSYPKPHIDIPAANAQLLLESGVIPEHIEFSGICTWEQHEQFYSARRGATGRFCSGIMLNNED
jgi:polyphenol oxidase